MKIRSANDVSKLGRIMGIWAHPDDETWTSGGLMAIARQNDQAVCCISATKGELGNQDPKKWDSNKLGSIREKELNKAFEVLDVNCHHWLDYKDGSCNKISDSDALAKITPIIEEFKPDTILTFGPTGTTGHTDHITVGYWAKQAVAKTNRQKLTNIYCDVVPHEWYQKYGKKLDEKFDIFFNIDEPPLVPHEHLDICLRLTDDILDKKIQALRAQKSQTEQLFANAPLSDIKKLAESECFSHITS